MKFLSVSKDGGPDSTVTAYWLVELKWLFSIALLRFDHGTRDVFHSHAFNSISWLISGALREDMFDGRSIYHPPGLWPITTKRTTVHRVFGLSPRSWALTFRGPWAKTWREELPDGNTVTLSNGRVAVEDRSLTP